MVDETITFELKNDPEELDRLARILEDVGQRFGMEKRCIFEMNLAIDELFTNIISYGFCDEKEHAVGVTVKREGETVTVTLEDDGLPFNPLTARKPDLEASLEETPVGGLGIHLCRSMMDNLCYRRCGNKNVVTLIKKLNPERNRSTGRK